MLVEIVTENGVKKIQALTADTGAGAPVGSIIVVCSNILPSGYLGLGVQYDITNYPALYQVLGTDTTPTASALGLPTLSSGQYAIKATSGLTENQQENVLNTINENLSYSTTEHKTGKKWIDGKDIYEITIVGTITGTAYTVAHGIANIDSICRFEPYLSAGALYTSFNAEGYYFTAIVGTTEILIRAHSGYTGGQYHIILEYTKTTDN